MREYVVSIKKDLEIQWQLLNQEFSDSYDTFVYQFG